MSLSIIYQVPCKDLKEKEAIILVLLSHGYTWRSRSKNIIPQKMSINEYEKSLTILLEPSNHNFGQISGKSSRHILDTSIIFNETDCRVFKNE